MCLSDRKLTTTVSPKGSWHGRMHINQLTSIIKSFLALDSQGLADSYKDGDRFHLVAALQLREAVAHCPIGSS